MIFKIDGINTEQLTKVLALVDSDTNRLFVVEIDQDKQSVSLLKSDSEKWMKENRTRLQRHEVKVSESQSYQGIKLLSIVPIENPNFIKTTSLSDPALFSLEIEIQETAPTKEDLTGWNKVTTPRKLFLLLLDAMGCFPHNEL